MNPQKLPQMVSIADLLTKKHDPIPFIKEWKQKAETMRTLLQAVWKEATPEQKEGLDFDLVNGAAVASQSHIVNTFVAQLFVAHLLGYVEVKFGSDGGLSGITEFTVRDKDRYNKMAAIPTLESTKIPKIQRLQVGDDFSAKCITKRKSMQNRYKNFLCFREELNRTTGQLVYHYDPSVRRKARA